MYPNQIRRRFLDQKSMENNDLQGTITLTIESEDKLFVQHLLDNLYLDFHPDQYDMNYILIDDKSFLNKRKIFIKKKKKPLINGVSNQKGDQMDEGISSPVSTGLQEESQDWRTPTTKKDDGESMG